LGKEKKISGLRALANCSTGHKYLITEIIKKQKRIQCISGEHISDCFSLVQADIGLTLRDVASDLVKKSSDLIVLDWEYFLNAMQYGRNLFENCRKYMQF